MAPEPLQEDFGPTRREILLRLKRGGPRSLQDLADDVALTRVAVLRHLRILESEGLVQRSYRRGGPGRPAAVFQLAPDAARLFPTAYADVSLCALRFLEERLGRGAVVELLQERAHEVARRHAPSFRGRDLPQRVDRLVQIREAEGYMAERGPRRRGLFEVREHNCPILAIAGEYGEACEVERRLFEGLLGARVETSHRVVAGEPVCRFVIRPRAEGP